MKCKVTDGFFDSKKGVYHPFGEVIIDDEREKEFLAAGVVSKFEKKTEELTGKKEEGSEDDDEIKDLKVTEIKNKLDELGVDYDPKAKKDELMQLLKEAE